MEGLSELLSFQWASDGGPVSLQEAGLRLVLAIVLSAAVGIDRELKHKPLGLRTNMLVALGAASFSLMALQLVHELAGGPSSIQIDPSRVMEAIVGAIGFLGAAAIIQGRFELFGATTGASIWVVGAHRHGVRLRLLRTGGRRHRGRPVRADGAGLHHRAQGAPAPRTVSADDPAVAGRATGPLQAAARTEVDLTARLASAPAMAARLWPQPIGRRAR